MKVTISRDCDVICPFCGSSSFVVWRTYGDLEPQAYCKACGWCALCAKDGEPCPICEATLRAIRGVNDDACQV